MSEEDLAKVIILQSQLLDVVVLREFKFEVQQNIACSFAPEGRDVYSLTVLFFIPKLGRSAIAFACLGEGPAAVSLLNGAISLGGRS